MNRTGAKPAWGRCHPAKWSNWPNPPLGECWPRAGQFRPALFDDSDGTSKREAYRQWTLGVVRPFGRLLAVELTEKLGSPVALKFDNYGTDMVGRSQVFSKLIAAEGVTKEMALAISGLMERETPDAI